MRAQNIQPGNISDHRAVYYIISQYIRIYLEIAKYIGIYLRIGKYIGIYLETGKYILANNARLVLDPRYDRYHGDIHLQTLHQPFEKHTAKAITPQIMQASARQRARLVPLHGVQSREEQSHEIQMEDYPGPDFTVRPASPRRNNVRPPSHERALAPATDVPRYKASPVPCPGSQATSTSCHSRTGSCPHSLSPRRHSSPAGRRWPTSLADTSPSRPPFSS